MYVTLLLRTGVSGDVPKDADLLSICFLYFQNLKFRLNFVCPAKKSKGDMMTAGNEENCIQKREMVEMKSSSTILSPSLRSLEDDLSPYFKVQGTRVRRPLQRLGASWGEVRRPRLQGSSNSWVRVRNKENAAMERQEGSTTSPVSLFWLSLEQLQAKLSRKEVAWSKGQGRGELQRMLLGAMGEEEVRRELLQLCSPVSRREIGLSARRRQQPSCRRWPDWREVAEREIQAGREERKKLIRVKAAGKNVKSTNVAVDDGPAPSTDIVNIEGYHFRSYKTYEEATEESSCY